MATSARFTVLMPRLIKSVAAPKKTRSRIFDSAPPTISAKPNGEAFGQNRKYKKINSVRPRSSTAKFKTLPRSRPKGRAEFGTKLFFRAKNFVV